MVGKFSWLGHKDQYEQKQTSLKNLITLAIQNGCSYNAEADKMVKLPFPLSSVR